MNFPQNEEMTSIQRRNANLRPIKKGQVCPWKKHKMSKNYWNWAKKLGGPYNFIKPMRRIFNIDRHTPITLECAIILKIGLEAMRGDMKAAEMWVDRIYGKVTQQMDISVPSGPLVQILSVAKVVPDEIPIDGVLVDATPLPPTAIPQEPQEEVRLDDSPGKK